MKIILKKTIVAIIFTISFSSLNATITTNYTIINNCDIISELCYDTIIIMNPNLSTYTYSIDMYAFNSCTSLKSITLPNGLISIGSASFVGCEGLESITIPYGVKNIGRVVFSGCSNLKSIALPNSVTSIGDHTFSYCINLAYVALPSELKKIPNSMFYRCVNLTSIALPNSVTSIGKYAFSSCANLISITLPSSVISIGEYAFSDCSSLKNVTFLNNDPATITLGNNILGFITNLETIYVPFQKGKAYKDFFIEKGYPEYADFVKELPKLNIYIEREHENRK